MGVAYANSATLLNVISTFETILRAIERDIESGVIATREECLERLRDIGLSSFGEIMFSLPNPGCPQISRLLPSMAAAETQRLWTGTSGMDLLSQSLDFVRITSARYGEYTGRSLRNSFIMDFGSGYGRLARLFYFFTPPRRLYMLDSYQKSIDECINHDLTTNLFLTDPIPQTLPVGEIQFDLIYSFSVFTHLNETATYCCLSALCNHLSPNGVLVITIRPYEFWLQNSHATDILRSSQIDPSTLVTNHQSGQFVFASTGGIGQPTYGDSSFNVDWITQKLPQLKVAFLDYSLYDSCQLYVGLVKR
jgi:SAM-dependent methyltransferase